MRAIIQRVMSASVSVGGEKISEIGSGLCVLVGISRDDTAQEMEHMVKKILNLKLFDGENDKRWAKNVMDKQYEVLCVSQFTLYSVLKGNKPDYHEAMGPETSREFYKDFFQHMKQTYKADKLKDGLFGEHMQVNIQNDGPVTISIDSPVFSQQEKEKFLRKQKVAIEKQAKQNNWSKREDPKPETCTSETNSVDALNENAASNITVETQRSQGDVVKNFDSLCLAESTVNDS